MRLDTDPYLHRYAQRVSGLSASAIRALFAVASRPEIVSFAVWNNHASVAVMRRIGMHHDAVGDFDHPGVPETQGHLRRHVLYRLSPS